MQSPMELARAELAGLAEHRVNQGGLAVVNVGDNGHVPDIVASDHSWVSADEEGRALEGSGRTVSATEVLRFSPS